jgi:hypothetical protein
MLKIDLIIQQQFGRIGLNIKNADYDLNINKGDFQVKQIPAEINVEHPKTNLEIDYTPFLESLGFGGIEYLLHTQKQEAQQDFYQNLAQTISEGNALGAIEKNISIGEVAGEATAPKEREMQIVSLNPVKVKFETSPLQWDAKLGGVEVAAQIGNIKITNFAFPSVQVFWQQEPYLKIETVGQVIDYQK